MHRKLILAHRYIGVASALFVIMLSITGIMLNHTEELALDEKNIQSSVLLGLYGIEAPEVGRGYEVQGQWLSQVGKQFYLNQNSITTLDNQLLGAIASDDFFIAATQNELILISPEGELIERLTALHGVPSDIKKIGVHSPTNAPLIQTAQGLFLSDQALFEWQASEEADAQWSIPGQLPDFIVTPIKESYLGEGLSLERVLLDLHSGRVAGVNGVYFMDFVAGLFLFLAGVGVWLWWKPRRR